MKKETKIYSKVLFIGPHLDNRGGISVVLNAYRRNLPEFHMLATNSVRGSLAGMFNFVRTLAVLPIYRCLGYRILEVHGANWKSWTRKSMIIRLGKLLGIKIAYHSHGGGFKNFVEERGVEPIRRILAKCSMVFFLSESWKEYADKTFGLGNIHVLNNMADTPAASRDFIEREYSHPIRFVFLGWFVREKGIFDLLDVVSENADYFRSKAIIALGGRYNEQQILEIIHERNISDIIDFRGWVAGEDKDKLLNDSDVLLLPSYIEGLPVSILEGMTYALPVISTNVGAIPEVLTDGLNGRMISPGDKAALFAAMKSYIEDFQLIRRQGNAAKEKSKNYTKEAVISCLTGFLESI